MSALGQVIMNQNMAQSLKFNYDLGKEFVFKWKGDWKYYIQKIGVV